MKPLFSVICVVRNESKTLPRLAHSLKEFLGRGGDWVVVDTGSTDGTPEVARGLGARVFEEGDNFIHSPERQCVARLCSVHEKGMPAWAFEIQTL